MTARRARRAPERTSDSSTKSSVQYHHQIDEATAPTNQADRLSRRFIQLFTAGEREQWLLMLSPDQVTRDRRPIIGVDTNGIDELAEVYPRDRDSRALSSTVETVAVRGESFALVRWHAISGSDREWDSLHLTRWTTTGLNALNVIFPPDQLSEALAELDALYAESLGDTGDITLHDR